MHFLISDREFSQQASLIDDFCRNYVNVNILQKDDYKLSVLQFIPKNFHLTLVIVPGQGEIEYKYQELLYCLRDQGMRIIVPFVRGQGHSSTTLKNSRACYIRNFKEYTDDLDFILKQMHITDYVMMGFSLGGLIALSHSIHNTLQPRRLCLIAPYCYPYTTMQPQRLRLLAKVAGTLIPRRYVPKHGAYKRISFEQNLHSHSQIRYEHYHDYYAHNPHLAPGGVTFAFLKACLQEQERLLEGNFSFNFKLMFLAALNDKIVSTDHCQKLAEHLAHCDNEVYFKAIKNAYHDILNEADGIRDETLYTAFNFLWKP